jgi:MazG family protein
VADVSGSVARLQEIVKALRAPDGCPWDREQTHRSLKPALVEECYEVVDAIDSEDDANFCEELGDLLLHVVMHAEMAGERGAFAFDAVVDGICEKLIRRHPHVFGDATAAGSVEVLQQWEQIKRAEKGAGASVLDGLPRALPALMRAQNVQQRVARVGFDWDEVGPVLDKIVEETAEVRGAVAGGNAEAVRDEIGDLLFSVVNLSRKLRVDSEIALTEATNKFARRFRAVESAVRASGRAVEDCSLAELDGFWEAEKAARG